ncbi:MAG: MaoC family dehydratase N-terminal domain-containing protein [Pseudomonadales bacterium]
MALLTPELLANIGKRAKPRREIATRRDIRKYSVATAQTDPRFMAGDIAPPLYHVALFWDVVPLEDLTPDGVSVDTLLPKLPLERAMAGGLNIEYHQPIKADDVLIANRTLTDLYEKEGRSGTLIFYEIVMEVTTESGAPVLTETTTRLLR